METVTVQIGNIKDQLKHREWIMFITDTRESVVKHCGKPMFEGSTSFNCPDQSFCIVAEVEDTQKESLKKDLTRIRKAWKQYAISITFGQTMMV